MILAIILLVIGILGFTKGRIDVSARRELRAPGLYVVATLFCLPIVVLFVFRAVIEMMESSGVQPGPGDTIIKVAMFATWGPILLAFILAFVLAKRKPEAEAEVRGFDVMTPPAPLPPSQGNVPPSNLPPQQ